MIRRPQRSTLSPSTTLSRSTDEELAPAGVLAGMRHGERAGDVLVCVLLRFALDRVSRAARADRSLAGLGVRVPTLDHEIRNYAMEFGPVVELCIRQLLEIRDRAGHFVREQLQLDRALPGLDHRFLVRHLHP